MTLLLIALAASLARVSLGGGLYEFTVVDPYWPRRPELIQPGRQPDVRNWLLVALASHAAMRIWSAFDFIPKALAFERAASVSEAAARSWARRSRMRMPLDLLTCDAMLAALAAASRAAA